MVSTLVREEATVLSPRDIVRAWEDRGFRALLSPMQLLQLPAHPAGGARLQAVAEETFNVQSMSSCDNCSSSNCSSDNCSSSNCSTDNCSSSNCSSNNCSTDNCSVNC